MLNIIENTGFRLKQCPLKWGVLPIEMQWPVFNNPWKTARSRSVRQMVDLCIECGWSDDDPQRVKQHLWCHVPVCFIKFIIDSCQHESNPSGWEMAPQSALIRVAGLEQWTTQNSKHYWVHGWLALTKVMLTLVGSWNWRHCACAAQLRSTAHALWHRKN